MHHSENGENFTPVVPQISLHGAILRLSPLLTTASSQAIDSCSAKDQLASEEDRAKNENATIPIH